MAVVGMHKLMGPLMTNAAGTGGVRIVLAANQLGEAIEHEVRIQKFLGKTKKKPDAELESVTNKQEQVIKNQEKLRRRVTQLMKKQKVHQVRRIVKFHDNTKPWGQEAHVKTISSENQPVRWVTPLGLPVVQPYRKLGRHLIKTSLQALTLQQETDKVMVKQQKTAFPPNFVCSLDGSHMMMTAVACKNANLNFAGVHDSYWTRACDVDQMNRVLRENFVELYYTPILENLLESFHKSFPNLHFPPLPERGDFDLREVLESTYFFN